MTVRMAGTVAHLEGDWTMTGVADNIDSLVISLKQMETEGGKSLQINCGLIEETDTGGLQLLNVWVECARLRGIEPKLMNVTDNMRKAIHELGFSHYFSDIFLDAPCYPAVANKSGTHGSKRILPHETCRG